jgi:DNA replication protein DnaC
LPDAEPAALPSIAEALVNDFAGFGLIAQQRNLLLVSGTGTSQTLPAIAIARSCIRAGAPRGRFYSAVDLVKRLETAIRIPHLHSYRQQHARLRCPD